MFENILGFSCFYFVVSFVKLKPVVCKILTKKLSKQHWIVKNLILYEESPPHKKCTSHCMTYTLKIDTNHQIFYSAFHLHQLELPHGYIKHLWLSWTSFLFLQFFPILVLRKCLICIKSTFSYLFYSMFFSENTVIHCHLVPNTT